jgi:hypothetical protein
MLAFTMSVAFSACSSSEESDDGGGCKKGDQGVCCDVDPMQQGCAQ